MKEIILKKPLARKSPADEYDVRRVKKALNTLGYYKPDEYIGISGIPDSQMFEAVTWFQVDNDLRPDGTMKPGDETLGRLNESLSEDRKGNYIWRTVGDEKVRPEHAALEGMIRQWGEDLEPGDEENCRCWAEPVSEDDTETLYPDAINPTVSPLDFIGPAAAGREMAGATVGGTAGVTGRVLLSRFRDVSWIRSVSQKQLQRKFKHALDFGIKGTPNKKNLESFKIALEKHVKSSDTQIIKGTYRGQKVTYYYNSRTGLNIIQNEKGEFLSGWKLDLEQIENLVTRGKVQ